ncbi:YncE family protein [Streptomyces sp. 891-h]|uniref:YncE family protein n=1 Tax=Streptomyces sp. 891-h TaxID=2720714 RepID=UPI001FAA6329|nr:YncE family protein [Streptomyces sp. 891-h]UNZ20836.1 YncE family protein [Streptomyces sp. 891-h]
MANNDLLAVVSQSGPTVSFFSVGTYRELGTVELPSEPHELCFDPARRLLYCSITYRSGYYHGNTGRAHEIAVIDPDEQRVTDVIELSPEHAPHGLVLDRDHDILYTSVEATDSAPGALLALDPGSRKVLRRIPVAAPGPHWFTVTPDGRQAYTTNKEAPYVSVVDLDSGRLLERIPVPGSEGVDISPDGRYVFAATPKADFSGTAPAGAGIAVIDTADHRVVRTLPAEGVTMPVHTTSGGLLLTGELRMTDEAAAAGGLGSQANGVLNVYSRAGSGERLLGQVEVGRFPLTITSSADGSLAYVSNVVSSTVTVVDLAALRPVATLSIPRREEPGAHGLAFVPAA